MDESNMKDLVNAPWNAWHPVPMVLGDHVYSWAYWHVTLREAVELKGSIQVTFLRSDNGTEITFREPLLAGEAGHFLRVGCPYGLIGLGEKMVHPNLYFYEIIYTGALEGGFQARYLSQGIVGRALNEESFPSRIKRERQQYLFKYLRDLYFWCILRAMAFDSDDEKQGALPEIRKDANDAAVKLSRDFFRFSGAGYRNNHLPRLEGDGFQTG